MLSPLYESVPPKLYGGTERVVSYITEELVKAGHEVTLFASGDSETSARLVPVCERALRLDPECRDPLASHFLMLEDVLRRQTDFDIIHSNVDYVGLSFAKRSAVPVVATLHGRLDIREVITLMKRYQEFPLISISNAQRRPMLFVNWLATIYHGLPPDLYSFNPNPGDYLVYIGRISPEKRVDSAIDIAVKSGMPLKIAAKVDKVDIEYFEQVIRPMLKHQLVEFLGEVGDRDKNALLGQALASLHPVDWPEPFGLSMIESMACGTPVLARRRGSVPEVIDHGITGFIFEKNEEAVVYLKNNMFSFSRRMCREQFARRFNSARMAGDYLKAYEKVLEKKGGIKRSA